MVDYDKDPTSEDRRAWAESTLRAFNIFAPGDVRTLTGAERSRLGHKAAVNMARLTGWFPRDEDTIRRDEAKEILGDLISYVYHLTFGMITAQALTEAAEAIRNGHPDAVEITGFGLGRAAALLACLLDTATELGCDVAALVTDAQEFYVESMQWDEEDEEDEETTG